MDSTVSKDSRDIMFARFGQVDYFLLKLQVQDEICNLNLNFKTRFDSVDWGAVWTGYVA
jgi:hypothetical protein